MFCEICKKKFKDSSFANYHLKKTHNIMGKEYYDSFLKKELEGICKNEPCQNKTTFKRINLGYADYCSKACTSRSSKTKAKSKATMLKNFGVEHALQSKTIRKKMEEKNFYEKGVKNVFQLENIKEEIKETNLKKFGVEYAMQNKDVLQKAVKTNLKKYGTPRPSQNKKIQEKIELTNLKKYKVKSTLQHKGTIDKINRTRRIKQWPIFNLILKEKKLVPLFDYDFYVEGNGPFKYKCKRCKKTFDKPMYDASKTHCKCLKYRSKYEDEIVESLRKITKEKIIPNKLFIDENNKRFEADIFLPESNTAVEFHGLFWHSEANKDKYYHRDKYNFFKKMGIPLIQIFENEWRSKEDVVFSVIKNKLKKNSFIYARKCDIQELSNNVYKEFLIKNHIQGYTNALHRIGLYYENELVSLASFGKSRYNKNYEYELIRSCSKRNFSIVGGFSKILKYFERTYKPKNIVSYIDLRYFDGSSYLKAGFKYYTINKPNYYYFHKNDMFNLYHRTQFQKSRIKKRFDNYDPKKTEHENMLINGFLRIYDAGTLTFVKDY